MTLSKINFFSTANPASKANASWLKLLFSEIQLGNPSKLAQWHGLAANDTKRAMELNFLNSANHDTLYMATRGGYGTMRALAEFLKTKPQINLNNTICGFSDLTVLLNYLTKLGVACWHGPMGSFPENPKKNLFLEKSFRALFYNQSFSIKIKEDFKHSPISGYLVGGNLSIFLSLFGTDFLPDLNNKILFLEDLAEDTYRIDRMLTQILNLKELKSLQAILLGQFTGCGVQKGSGFNKKMALVIEDFKAKCPVLVLDNLPFGHIIDALALPMDRLVTLDSGSIFWDAKKD